MKRGSISDTAHINNDSRDSWLKQPQKVSKLLTKVR